MAFKVVIDTSSLTAFRARLKDVAKPLSRRNIERIAAASVIDSQRAIALARTPGKNGAKWDRSEGPWGTGGHKRYQNSPSLKKSIRYAITGGGEYVVSSGDPRAAHAHKAGTNTKATHTSKKGKMMIPLTQAVSDAIWKGRSAGNPRSYGQVFHSDEDTRFFFLKVRGKDYFVGRDRSDPARTLHFLAVLKRAIEVKSANFLGWGRESDLAVESVLRSKFAIIGGTRK